MKSLIRSLIIVIICIFILQGSVYAENALDKLSRGAINIFTSPLELFQTIGESYEEGRQAVTVPVGVIKGSWNTLRRFGVGVYEIVTFPIPFPKNYGPVIEDPAYFGKTYGEEESN